jgi:GAF domain-containing protein
MSSTAHSPANTKRQRGHQAAGPISHHRSDMLAAVLQITGQIAGILDLEPLLAQLAQQTRAQFGYSSVALLLVEGDMLMYRACAGEQTQRLGLGLPCDAESLPARALRRGKPIHTVNRAAFPICGDTQPYGVIELERANAGRWGIAELDALAALARQAGIAIQNAQQHMAARQQVRELALLDQIRASVVSQPSLPDLLHDVVDKIAAMLGYSLVSLYTLRGEQLLLKHQLGYSSLPGQLNWNDGALGEAARTGIPMLQRGPAHSGTEHAANVTSSLCVALRAGGVVFGIVCIESAAPRLLTTNDQRAATTGAGRSGGYGDRVQPAVRGARGARQSAGAGG